MLWFVIPQNYRCGCDYARIENCPIEDIAISETWARLYAYMQVTWRRARTQRWTLLIANRYHIKEI